MATKEAHKYAKIEDCFPMIQALNVQRCTAWRIEYHSPVITSKNDIFNEKEYYTLSFKAIEPYAVGKVQKWHAVL